MSSRWGRIFEFATLGTELENDVSDHCGYKCKDRNRHHHKKDEGIVYELTLLGSSITKNIYLKKEKFGNNRKQHPYGCCRYCISVQDDLPLVFAPKRVSKRCFFKTHEIEINQH